MKNEKSPALTGSPLSTLRSLPFPLNSPPFPLRSVVQAAACLALLGAIGCTPAEPIQPQEPIQPDPRQQLDRVMERFKRRYVSFEETMPGGGDGELTGRFRFVVEGVHYQPPQIDPISGNLTAEVTVRTSTSFSALTLIEDETEPDPDPEPDESDPLTGEDDTPSRRKPPQAPGEGPGFYETANRRDRQVKTYDLAYEDGRWVLKSTGVDEAVRYAFGYALAEQ